MKSIQVKVPKSSIKEFYPHPELYGDFIVLLDNSMYTDVYYDEDGDYYTITNDQTLITYLKRLPQNPISYFYRNGVVSFRTISVEDDILLSRWNNKLKRHIKFQFKQHKKYEIFPAQSILMFYWMDIGVLHKETIEDTIYFRLSIYDEEFLSGADYDMLKIIFKELI